MNSPIEVKSNGDGTYSLTFKCFSCKKDKILTVKSEELLKYKTGVHVQHAFPTMNASDKELFISGMCGACWDKMFVGTVEREYLNDYDCQIDISKLNKEKQSLIDKLGHPMTDKQRLRVLFQIEEIELKSKRLKSIQNNFRLQFKTSKQ